MDLLIELFFEDRMQNINQNMMFRWACHSLGPMGVAHLVSPCWSPFGVAQRQSLRSHGHRRRRQWEISVPGWELGAGCVPGSFEGDFVILDLERYLPTIWNPAAGKWWKCRPFSMSYHLNPFNISYRNGAWLEQFEMSHHLHEQSSQRKMICIKCPPALYKDLFNHIKYFTLLCE